nr:leucine-rich repeat domain-containing protein [Bacteroidota bacterium]
GDSINTNRVRYIEINLDEVQKDLKIASIYTTKLNERLELQKWWSDLPLHWKEILGAGFALNDTLRMKDVLYYNDSLARLNRLVERVICRDTFMLVKSDTLIVALSDSALISLSILDKQLKRITRIDTIDISGRSEIMSLEPLSRLTHLRKLNCSHTLVMSLVPLRNLTHLEVLDCSHTPVDNIAALRYTSRLEELILNDTWIDEIKTISNFYNLQKLHFNATKVDSLDPLAKLSKLKDLEFAGTNIVSLEPLKGLTNLERFDFSDTRVNDLTPLNGLVKTYFLKFENTPVEDLWPLKDMSRLQLLFINKTKVNNLDPLNDLPELTVVYCDQTGITREKANIFMEQNQNVLVVYESADLHFWWTSLSSHWKGFLAGRFSISGVPSREQLHQITRIKHLDISKYPLIQTLDPLLKLPLLNELDCHNTGISDLSPIESLLDLKKLNILGTRVVNLTPLSRLTKLETLNFDNTDVNNISPLINLSDLRTIYCDKTLVLPEDIISFMGGHMDCMVVYQTESLELWWNSLLGIW